MSYDDYGDDPPARHGRREQPPRPDRRDPGPVRDPGSFRDSGFFQGGNESPRPQQPPPGRAPEPRNPLLRAARQSPPDYHSVREVTQARKQPVRNSARGPGRRSGLVALAILLAVAVLAGGGYAGSRWFQSRPTTAAGPAGPAGTAVKGESTTAPTAGGAASSGRTVGRIGTALRDGDFAFKVTEVRDGGGTLGSGAGTVKATGRFVLVYMTVKNLSDRPQALLPAAQHLQDASSREYAADPTVPAAASRRLWVTLRPGAVARGIMVFDVPEAPPISNVLLQGSVSSPGAKLAVR